MVEREVPVVARIDNAETFAALAMPLFDSLFNFACWLAQDRAEAEDLVQETFAKALKGFASFELGTNFRAWMFRILRNTFLTSRAGLRADVQSIENEEQLPPAADTPETIMMSAAAGDALQRELQDLPVHYREVLLLCDVEEMSYRDISVTLDIPIGTVMSRIARARRQLLNRLAEQGYAISKGRRA